MWNLYGTKRDGTRRLVATFDSEQQLLSYVHWATLKSEPDGTFKFEQNTPLTGCVSYDFISAATDETAADDAEQADGDRDVPRNPTPSML